MRARIRRLRSLFFDISGSPLHAPRPAAPGRAFRDEQGSVDAGPGVCPLCLTRAPAGVGPKRLGVDRRRGENIRRKVDHPPGVTRSVYRTSARRTVPHRTGRRLWRHQGYRASRRSRRPRFTCSRLPAARRASEHAKRLVLRARRSPERGETPRSNLTDSSGRRDPGRHRVTALDGLGPPGLQATACSVQNASCPPDGGRCA